jgi:hypothetical protein
LEEHLLNLAAEAQRAASKGRQGPPLLTSSLLFKTRYTSRGGVGIGELNKVLMHDDPSLDFSYANTREKLVSSKKPPPLTPLQIYNKEQCMGEPSFTKECLVEENFQEHAPKREGKAFITV